MIRPTIAPLKPELLPGLRELFTACNADLGEWQFNPERTVLALWQGQVVGFVTSWWDNQPIAWVDMLMVHPDFKGQGIGVWLAGTIEALLRMEGAKVIRCVLDDTQEFVEPLAKAGFSRIGNYLLMERHYES